MNKRTHLTSNNKSNHRSKYPSRQNAQATVTYTTKYHVNIKIFQQHILLAIATKILLLHFLHETDTASHRRA